MTSNLTLSASRNELAARRPWVVIAGVSLTLLLSSAANGQLAAQLDAIRIRNGIQLALEVSDETPTWRFREISSATGGTALLPDSQRFSIERRPPMRLELRFLNPVRYGWTVSTKSVEDPTAASLGTFVKAVTDLLSTVGVSTVGATGPTTSNKPTAAAPAPSGAPVTPGGANTDTLILQQYIFEGLQSWNLWLKENTSCFEAAPVNRVAEVLHDADMLAFKPTHSDPSDPLFGPTSLPFREALKERANGLVTATTASGFRSEMTSMSDLLQAISAAQTKLDFAIGSVRRIKQVPILTSKRCDAFQRFTESAFRDFFRALLAEQNARGAALVSLKALLDRLDGDMRGLSKGDGADADAFHLADPSVKDGKLELVTVVVKERELDPLLFSPQKPDRKSWSTTLQLIEKSDILVDVSPGFMYSRIRFPVFSVDSVDGKRIIARQPDDIQSTTTVLMLNLYPRAWGVGPVRLLGQIGVGTSKQYPLLLTGMGFRILPPADFSLAFGAAWAFVRDLSGRAVGDKVTDASDLEKSLTTRLRPTPTFYIGLQRALP